MFLLKLRNWQAILITLISGISIALWAYSENVYNEQRRLQQEFSDLAQEFALRVQGQLDHSLEVLTAYNAFFISSESVSREEYRSFSSVIIPQREEVFAVHWSPRVSHQDRAAAEQALKTAGLAPLGIFDVSRDAGIRKRAGIRPEYYPITFAEPLNENREAIGLDPLARPYNTGAIREAAQTGKKVSTPPFPVVQDPDGPLAIAVYQPIYTTFAQQIAPENRERALEGYIILMLKPAVVMKAMAAEGQGMIHARLKDIDDKEIVIYPRGNHSAIPGYADGLNQTIGLTIPGREWQLEVWPTQEYIITHRSFQPLIISLAGVLLTLLMAFFLHRVFRRNESLTKTNQFLEEKQKLLDRLAYYDPLTDLPNRAYFSEQVRKRLDMQDEQTAHDYLCLLDLDAFKPINDQYGHKAGDEVLKVIANRMRAALSDNEVVARLGGDEFVLLLTGRAEDELVAFFERLLPALAAPVWLQDEAAEVSVSASVGGAELAHYLDQVSLMHAADDAMYAAKERGKNCFVLDRPVRYSSEQVI